MSNWEVVRLSEISNMIKRGISPKYIEDGGLPIINQKCIRNNVVSLEFSRRCSTEKLISVEKLIKVGDILVNSTGTGTLGRTGWIKELTEPTTVDSHVTIVRPNQILVSDKFIALYLSLKENEIESMGKGATNQTELSASILGTLKINLPPLETQKRIASILSTYDDLIENNLKRIKLLEETAQNIYKEWFVNFRFPNYEHTEFDSESGLPVGWNICPLNNFVDFKEGPGLRNWQFKDEGVPFLNIRMMGDGELDFSSVKYLDGSEIETKYSHFLLSEHDHIVSTSGTLGKVVTIRQSHLPLCLNTSIIRMRPLREEIGKWQLREILKSPDFINEMKSYATGSAQLNFGPKHLNLMMLKVPSPKIGLQFEMIISPIEIQICSLLDINQKLKEARDILLPRLMNRTIEL